MNSNNLFKTAANLIVCTAVNLCLIIIASAVPMLLIPALFISGLVCIYVLNKSNMLGTVFSICLTLAAFTLISKNLFNAQANKIYECIILYLIGILPGFSFGAVSKKKISFENKYFITALASILMSLVFVVLLKVSGLSVTDAIADAAKNYKDMLTSAIEQSGIDVTQNVTSVVTDVIDQTIQLLTTYLPTIFIVFSIICAYLTVIAGIFVLHRFKVCKVEYTKFNMIQIPQFICLITSVLFIVMFMSEGDGLFQAVIGNIAVISEFLIGVSGFSTVDYFFAKKIRSGYIRVLLYLCVFSAGFLFASLIWELLIVIGFIDSLWHIRFRDSIRGE